MLERRSSHLRAPRTSVAAIRRAISGRLVRAARRAACSGPVASQAPDFAEGRPGAHPLTSLLRSSSYLGTPTGYPISRLSAVALGLPEPWATSCETTRSRDGAPKRVHRAWLYAHHWSTSRYRRIGELSRLAAHRRSWLQIAWRSRCSSCRLSLDTSAADASQPSRRRFAQR